MAGLQWDDVPRLAAEGPEVEAGTACGTLARRVCGSFPARLRGDGKALVVSRDSDERPLLLRAHPGVLHTTTHDEGAPYVFVALPRAGRRLVREPLEDARSERASSRLGAAWRASRAEG